MTPRHSVSACLALACAVLFPAVASAHINLVQPPSRYDKYNIKSAPCGDGGDTRSDDVQTYRPGQKITVEWNEYIDHPGHFRIAFDPDGTDDFAAPKCTSNCSTTNPEFEYTINDAVLADDIGDKSGGTYSKQIQLPDTTCDRCTLQVIQVMYDKPPIEVPGNDIYYQCADLKLVAASGDDTGVDSDTGPSSDTGPTSDTGDSSPDTDDGTDDTGTRPTADSGDPRTDAGEHAADGGTGSSNSQVDAPSGAGDGGGGGCSMARGDPALPTFPSLTVCLLLLGWRTRRDA